MGRGGGCYPLSTSMLGDGTNTPCQLSELGKEGMRSFVRVELSKNSDYAGFPGTAALFSNLSKPPDILAQP